VGGDHDQLPVREVDEPQHAEDEPDPDGDQRVHRPQPDGIDQCLDVGHAKYAATSRSVSPASAGESVIRSSPWERTCVRSASATVLCARCSTSSTATPRSRITVSASKTTSTSFGARPSDGSSSSSTFGPA